jgi:branched-chain amino acid transport system permease protein
MEYYIGLITMAAIQALLGLSVYVLVLAGRVSFGQHGFALIGGYMAGVATAVWGWHIVPALLLGMVASGLVGVLVGYPALRIRGVYLAVASIAFAEICRNLVQNLFYYREEVVGGLLKKVGPVGAEGFRHITYFYERGFTREEVMGVVLGVLAATTLAVWLLDRSRLGRRLRAIGEEEVAAQMAGINVAGLTTLAFGLGAAIAALSGGLYAHYLTFVSHEIYTLLMGTLAVAYVLVGGPANVLGPLLGVAFFTVIAEGLRPVGEYRILVYGALIVIAMLVRPYGIIEPKLLARLRRWTAPLFPWTRARREATGDATR